MRLTARNEVAARIAHQQQAVTLKFDDTDGIAVTEGAAPTMDVYTLYSQFVVDDTSTAIDDLQIADGDSKNGNNRQWFDLLGRSRIDHRKAANPQWNGIYVKDGRKVVVTSTER